MTWTINATGHVDGDEPERRAEEEKVASSFRKFVEGGGLNGLLSASFAGNYHTETFRAPEKEGEAE